MKIRKANTFMDWIRIYNLYMEAFPANERKPILMIRRMFKNGKADVWVLNDPADKFVGLAITLNGKDIVLLDYFAIDKKRRSGGWGSKALEQLQKIYSDRRLILEIERCDLPSENQKERIRRKAFYLRNDMQELGIPVNLFGVEMELLAYDCKVTFEEYKGIYVDAIGELARRNVNYGKC